MLTAAWHALRMIECVPLLAREPVFVEGVTKNMSVCRYACMYEPMFVKGLVGSKP